MVRVRGWTWMISSWMNITSMFSIDDEYLNACCQLMPKSALVYKMISTTAEI